MSFAGSISGEMGGSLGRSPSLIRIADQLFRQRAQPCSFRDPPLVPFAKSCSQIVEGASAELALYARIQEVALFFHVSPLERDHVSGRLDDARALEFPGGVRPYRCSPELKQHVPFSPMLVANVSERSSVVRVSDCFHRRKQHALFSFVVS